MLAPDLTIDASPARVNSHLPAAIKGEHIIGLGIGPLHPGRADRHAGHTEARQWRLLLQQTKDEIGRHVPFDNIPSDKRGVAGLKRSRHSMLGLYLIELRIVDILHVHIKAIRL